MKSAQIICSILLKTQKNNKTVPQDYFVGVTSDPQKRVFYEHNLCKQSSTYAFFEAKNKTEAKKALSKLLSFHMNGFKINDNVPGKYVYYYLIEGTSKEIFSRFE